MQRIINMHWAAPQHEADLFEAIDFDQINDLAGEGYDPNDAYDEAQTDDSNTLPDDPAENETAEEGGDETDEPDMPDEEIDQDEDFDDDDEVSDDDDDAADDDEEDDESEGK